MDESQSEDTSPPRRDRTPRTSRRRLIQGATGAAFVGLAGRGLLRAPRTRAAGLLPASTNPEILSQLENAMPIFMKFEGVRQGWFVGEVPDPLRESPSKVSLGLGFEQVVTAPRDAATGQATGRRQHSPIIVTKEWGAASPQLFQALVTNESLKTVQFDFYTPAANADGTAQRFFTIKLSNAFVSKIEKYEHFNATGHQDANDERFLEDVSLTFQKIDIMHVASASSASDATAN